MSKPEAKVKVGIKYCGSCNPHLNLVKIAAHLSEISSRRQDFKVVYPYENDIDIMVILCGCPRACGNREDIRAAAKQSLVLAGEFLQGRPIVNDYMIAVEQELNIFIKAVRRA